MKREGRMNKINDINSEDYIIPWNSLSESAKMSFIYRNPDVIVYEKSWEDEIYESAKDSPNEFIRCQQETSGKILGVGKGKKFIINNDKLNIIAIAKQLGFKVKGNMIKCPFHDDKDPSLSLDDKKNVFYCFGCQAKGDVIEFYRKVKDGQKTSN